MKIDGPSQWDDLRSIAAMQPQYFTSEPFLPWVYDLRLQKIGNHYRAFRRTSKHWKSNVDINMKDEDCEILPHQKRWLEEAAQYCGMDICAMDVLQVPFEGQVDEEGNPVMKEYILELNSSAIGLNGRHHDEDLGMNSHPTLLHVKSIQDSKFLLLTFPNSIVPDVGYMRELVLMRMEAHFTSRAQQSAKLPAQVHALLTAEAEGAAEIREGSDSGSSSDPGSGSSSRDSDDAAGSSKQSADEEAVEEEEIKKQPPAEQIVELQKKVTSLEEEIQHLHKRLNEALQKNSAPSSTSSGSSGESSKKKRHWFS